MERLVLEALLGWRLSRGVGISHSSSSQTGALNSRLGATTGLYTAVLHKRNSNLTW